MKTRDVEVFSQWLRASSETDRKGKQKGLCQEDSQCRLEKKSRTTNEVQRLLSGEFSHTRLLGTPFSLFSSPIPPPERVPPVFVDNGMNAHFSFWTISFFSLTGPGPGIESTHRWKRTNPVMAF